MLGNPGARAWLANGSLGGLWQFAREFGRDFGTLFEGLLHDLTIATADADVVLYSAVCMAAAQLHEVRGIPVMAGFLQPLTPTHAFPAAGLSYREPTSTWDRRRNRLTHIVGEQLLWQPSRRTVNRWRARTLNAPPVAFLGPFAAQRSIGISDLLRLQPRGAAETIGLAGMDRPDRLVVPRRAGLRAIAGISRTSCTRRRAGDDRLRQHDAAGWRVADEDRARRLRSGGMPRRAAAGVGVTRRRRRCRRRCTSNARCHMRGCSGGAVRSFIMAVRARPVRPSGAAHRR